MLYAVISLVEVKRKTPAAPRTESAAPQSQSVYKWRFDGGFTEFIKGFTNLGGHVRVTEI